MTPFIEGMLDVLYGDGKNEPVLVAELTSTAWWYVPVLVRFRTSTARLSDQYWFKFQGTIKARYLLA